jgi:hypothetical protein
VCILTFPSTAPIASDVTLSSDAIFALNGAVFVGAGINADGSSAGDNGSLTIEAGTTVVGTAGAGFENATSFVASLGESVSDSDVDYLVVSPNSQLNVNGTASAPVIMTGASDLTGEVTDGAEAQWGGLVISGLAAQNNCNEADLGTAACTAEGEGASGYYGGTNDEDNSGSINYMQVKYAGYRFSNDDELNGVAFQAVGSGTSVNYIQVHNGSDDGIEFFGGTVGMKHFVVTGASDDSVDWTDGWRGFAQYGVVIQTLFPVTDAARPKDNVIEADNYGSDMDRSPRSFPAMANITFVQDYGGDTLQLREGTGVKLLNSIVSGNAEDSSGCVDVDDDETYRFMAQENGLSLAGTLFDSIKCGAIGQGGLVQDEEVGEAEFPNAFSVSDYILTGNNGAHFGASGLHGSMRNAAYITHPLASGYSLASASAQDANLDDASFIGGVESDANDWTRGWTFGLHMDSFECPYGTTLGNMKDGAGAACEIVSAQTEDKNIRLVGGGLPYLMVKQVKVGTGAADGSGAKYLQVDPGVTLYSDSYAGEGAITDFDAVLVPIHSKIMINGAPGAPVTMTSGREVRDTAADMSSVASDWGGLVINGLASQTACNLSDVGTANCTADGEGGSGSYGGVDDADNSGNIFYLVLKHAGRLFNSEDELNGIAFQAVGNLTELNYIQTYNTSDDGVEFFGGTVNAKNLLVMGASDDSIDWTDGWRGNVQYAIVWQNQGQTFDVDRSIEADNYGSDMDREPRSLPTFANLTIVSRDGQAVLLREGTGLNIYNSVVADEGASTCWDIDNDETYDFNGDGTAGEGHDYDGNLFACATLAQEDSSGPTVAQIEALLSSNTNTASAGGASLAGYVNGATESALTPVTVAGDFFEATDYVGAVPSADADWTDNWAFKPASSSE